MPELTYTDEPHEYRLDGVVIPSVTQVLKEAGLIDVSGPWFTEACRERGENVALITELYDKSLLDESAVADELRGYLEAWAEFRRVWGFVPEQIEVPVYAALYEYAGTPDRVGALHDVRTVADIKTGGPAPWHGLQTAAYSECYRGGLQRIGVHLKADGTYKVHPHDDPDDRRVFLAALTLANWKYNKKVKA